MLGRKIVDGRDKPGHDGSGRHVTVLLTYVSISVTFPLRIISLMKDAFGR
jgi:hypothetical protein